jgi:hypothetical protein
MKMTGVGLCAGLLLGGVVGCTSGSDEAPSRPSPSPTTEAAPTATSGPAGATTTRTRDGLADIAVPDAEGSALRRSGRGRSTVSLPRIVDGHPVRRVKVYLVCAPDGAHFEVGYGGAPKFWGACADQGGAVAGAFPVTSADHGLTIRVAPDVSWRLAVTSGAS